MSLGRHFGKFCEPYFSKNQYGTSLRRGFKKFLKSEMSDKTLGTMIKELCLRYDLEPEEAQAMILYVMKKGLVNANDKILGGKGRYWHELIDKLYSDVADYLPADFKPAIDELANKAKKIPSYRRRLSLLFHEADAYLYTQRRLALTKVQDLVMRADSYIGEKVEKYLFSKPLFWLGMSILVFDTLDCVYAGDENIQYSYNQDDDTIDMHHPSWYQRREYVGRKERIAWSIYDNLIEEIGRDMIASSLQEVGFRLASHGLKLVAKSVLTLAMFHPALAGIRTIAEGVNVVANILEGSFILRTVAQPFVEWKLEGWLGMHEWGILRRMRDKLAEVFQPEEYQKHFRRVMKGKEFAKWIKDYTDEIPLKDLPYGSRRKRKLRELGYEELPPEMQRLYDDYMKFCKKISAYDVIEQFNKDTEKIDNELSHMDITRTSTLTQFEYRANETIGLYNTRYGENTINCDGYSRWEYGISQYKSYDCRYNLKFLNEETWLKQHISSQK